MINTFKIIKNFAERQVFMFFNRINKNILPKPFNVYFLITTRCNADCKFCLFSRSNNGKQYDEASDEEIINMLLSLKQFMGSFHINISGGEPLVRQSCLLKAARFAKKNHIMLGFTTNGFLLNNIFCEEVMKKDLFFNINVSVDSVGDEHCKNRGIHMSFTQLKDRLIMLSNYKKKYSAKTKLIIKSIIKADNLEHLVKLVEFTKDIKFNCINFQPIDESTEISRLSKKNVSISNLEKIFDSLLVYKQKYPHLILNEKRHFKMFLKYFTGNLKRGKNICDVGFKNLFILPNLDVTFGCYEKFANLNEESIDIFWKSKKANKIREKIKKCRRLCLTTCQLRRTLLEKINYGYKILLKK